MVAEQIIVGTDSKHDQLQSRKLWNMKTKDNTLETKKLIRIHLENTQMKPGIQRSWKHGQMEEPPE